MQHGDGDHDYLVISGSLKDSSKQIGVAIVTTKLPSTIEVGPAEKNHAQRIAFKHFLPQRLRKDHQ